MRTLTISSCTTATCWDISSNDKETNILSYKVSRISFWIVRRLLNLLVNTLTFSLAAFQYLDSYEEVLDAFDSTMSTLLTTSSQYFSKNPIALARHGAELKRNPRYATFIEQCLRDPRLLRNGFTHFLSRPVFRLPKAKMTLAKMKESTPEGHPDLDELPIVNDILHDFLKKSEEVVKVADAKVKFWEICEGLIYKPGEILVSSSWLDVFTSVNKHFAGLGSLRRDSNSVLPRSSVQSRFGYTRISRLGS